MLIRENALEQLAKEHRVALNPGVQERMEMKLIEIFLRALDKAREEGRMFIRPSDIQISSKWKGLVIKRLGEGPGKQSRPMVERKSARFGVLDIVERTKEG